MCYIALHCFSRLPSSLYLSRMMAKDKEIIKKHIFYFALRAKEFTAQQPRGNPSKALSFAEVTEVSRDWVHSGPMRSELWRGVL